MHLKSGLSEKSFLRFQPTPKWFKENTLRCQGLTSGLPDHIFKVTKLSKGPRFCLHQELFVLVTAAILGFSRQNQMRRNWSGAPWSLSGVLLSLTWEIYSQGQLETKMLVLRVMLPAQCQVVVKLHGHRQLQAQLSNHLTIDYTSK
jgi:hypothetical protein